MMSMIIFYVFLAAESDIRFTSLRLDLAVPELWIFAFLLKSEKKFRASVIYNYNLDVFLCILEQEIRKKY